MSSPTPETQPVINSPYTEPRHHWELDEDGRALPSLMDGRRTSAFRAMVPQSRKAQTQVALFIEEKYHEFINEVRTRVATWRLAGYPNLSRPSRDLLTHWQSTPEENGPAQRLFFAQVEALETLMWLYEAPVKDTESFRRDLDADNASLNEGCNRLAVRMATGTGKTTVMAMLIAWHTVLYRHGSRTQKEKHAQTFVIITPGLTVKERLQELDPKNPGNIYAPTSQNLLPRKYTQDIQQACVKIVNFQAFRQRDSLEGVSADQKKMIAKSKLRRGMPTETQQEDYGSMLDRVLGLPSGPAHRNVVVLNDEAHHCYGDIPEKSASGSQEQRLQIRETFSKQATEDTEEIKRAKQWFGILAGLHKQKRLLVAHDLSATPYYVSHQWIRFPWILSDYDLHEAMEAGLVKIPRVPVDDDANADDVMLRELYKNTKPKALKRDAIPSLVELATQSLYKSYTQRFEDWKNVGHERLPVLIVVANNISNATALYDWIAGYQSDEGWVEGAFSLLSNVHEDRKRKESPVTIMVHSDKLEDNDTAGLTGTGADRMKLVTEEVAKSRNEEDLADGKKKQAEYLRHILATVGKADKPGEKIRCVVSVSMLTEGWDARTVTHILGFRAFNSPLLCEQVAGRALRRVNYQSMKEFAGEQVLTAEYSEILGIPFRFSNAQDGEPPRPPEKTIEVLTQKDHQSYRIGWPQVEAYRRRIQSGTIRINPSKVQPFDATSTENEPTISELAGIVGEIDLLDSPEQRQQRVQYEFTRHALRELYPDDKQAQESSVPPNLRRFTQLLLAARVWLAHPEVKTSQPWWQLVSPSVLERAIKSFLEACDTADDSLQIAVDLAEPPLLDTADIRFETSISGEMPDRRTGPVAYPARTNPEARRPFNKRSELNVAVCDSHLEWRIAEILDSDAMNGTVMAWARNLRLGWTIPWLDETRGLWHDYIPDFAVRMADCPETGQRRHIVLEGKGYNDEHWNEKRDTVLEYWLPGVNASTDDACSGKWILLEVRPDDWTVERAKQPHLVCTVGKLAVSLQQLMSKEHKDAWN